MKMRHITFLGILVLVVAVSLVSVNLKNRVSDKDGAISDFLEAVGYRDVDFNAKEISANPSIIEEIENMIGASLKLIEFTNVHAEAALDDNLSAKGYIQLSFIEDFIKQFKEVNAENIYEKEFDKGMVPFGDSSLKWWNPVQTESSKTVGITRLADSLEILITPVEDEKAEVYISWFEM